jgi:glycosyltransferase involved in cell wall biosynthesis
MDNGFIAEYKSSASLAEGIQLLLDDGELLLKMKQRCRELSRREYDMDLECARYLELYNRLMGAAAQRRVP